MTYSKLEPDSNFANNSASNFDSFDSTFKSDESEPDFSSVFMNLNICIFLKFYICILLNKPADGFLSSFIIESIVKQAMKV